MLNILQSSTPAFRTYIASSNPACKSYPWAFQNRLTRSLSASTCPIYSHDFDNHPFDLDECLSYLHLLLPQTIRGTFHQRSPSPDPQYSAKNRFYTIEKARYGLGADYQGASPIFLHQSAPILESGRTIYFYSSEGLEAISAAK